MKSWREPMATTSFQQSPDEIVCGELGPVILIDDKDGGL